MPQKEEELRRAGAGIVAPMVEHVLSVCEGLGSMSNTKAITRVGKVKVVQMILSLLSSRTPGSGYEQRHMGSS